MGNQHFNTSAIIIAELSERVNEYESSLPLTEEQSEIYLNTKSELEEKLIEKTYGQIFRSKVKWYEEGEKNTKYFYALEKARYNAKTCYKIITEDGEEIVEQRKILEKQKNFYEQLYQDEEVNFTLQNTTSIKVPENIKEDQNIQLTVEDLESAIKRMNNNKTPGYDGLPIEFYKVFWVQIKSIFMLMMEECYAQEYMHQSARQGILNLIPKAQKDTRYIKNLRPITLLNTDYKIIEKAVADKMIPALDTIINRDQRGFMKDRRISVNIRKMLDIIHMAKETDLEAVILSLDFVKCF